MKTNRQELLNILSAMMPGLASKRSAVNQGDRFIFQSGRVLTFNDEIGISHPVPFDFEGAVLADELWQLLKRHRSKEVDIEITDNELLVCTRTSKAGIILEAPDEDSDQEITLPKQWISLPEGFLDAYNLAALSAGRDVSDLILTYVQVADGIIWGTDNMQIIGVKIPDGIKKPFLLPASTAKTLSEHNPLKYAVADNWVHFKNDAGVTFSIRTVNAEFPDVSTYFSKTKEKVVIKGDWIDALDRVKVFAIENAQGQVIVSSIKGGVLLQAECDTGWIKEKLRAECPAGTSFAIHVSVLEKALEKSASFGLGENSLVVESEDFKYTVLLLQETTTNEEEEGAE